MHGSLVANHLWQSTVFLVAAALMTTALRTSRARARYWIWLAASIKFLIPFSLLIGIGSQLAWRAPRPAATARLSLLEISQPFDNPNVRLASTVRQNVSPAILLLAVWLTGTASIGRRKCVLPISSAPRRFCHKSLDSDVSAFNRC